MSVFTKEKIHQTIDELPESFTLEDVMERLHLLHKIENGLTEVELEQSVSTEEARKTLGKWLS